MVARRAGKAVGTGIGAAVGGFFTNPVVLIIAALGFTLFIFRDKISQFVSDAIGGIELPDINLPDINLPSFEFPSFEFPSFEFPSFDIPEFPSFDLCSLFGIGCDEIPPPPDQPTTPSVKEVLEECNENCVIKQDAQGVVTTTCTCDGQEFSSVGEPTIPPEPIPEPPPPIPIIIDPELEVEGEFTGGGPSFIGGSIGQTPVTTLFQVLDLFSGFSASQAANFLFQFSGISPSDALQLEQFQEFI